MVHMVKTDGEANRYGSDGRSIFINQFIRRIRDSGEREGLSRKHNEGFSGS